MARFVIAALMVFAVLIGGYAAHAQLGADPLTIQINPDYPRPFQAITITPDSNLIDLAASEVTITVNGEVVLRGSGRETAVATVGGAGTVTNIVVTAVNEGQTYTARATVRPADVALVLEPQTTSHPFYEGSPLVGSESRLRIVAIPDLRTAAGAPIAAANLVYTWRNGDQVLQSASGIGKQVLTGVAPVRYRDTTISVTVSTQDQSVVGIGRVIIAPIDPVVRMYENDPLLGPRFETALSRPVTITESEVTYRAVPFHFGSLPTLTWSVNGTASQAGQDITVRPSGSGRGRAMLSVQATATQPRQAGRADLSVLFGTARSSIFGF